jgi:hypothetical protein
MNRILLGLPVLLLAMPLLVMLLLASPPPGSLPDKFQLYRETSATGDFPTQAEMDHLARTDPIAFLENCLRRYDRDVQGYRLTMYKQERLNGKLRPHELIDVCFREEPHSVYLRWREGARKAERALYVEGENNDKMLARPHGALLRQVAGDVAERDVEGVEAHQSGRFTLNHFGLKKGTERYLASWKSAQDTGTLRVQFVGEHLLPEAGNRLCYHLRRSCLEPENDGVMEQTLFVDKESWLQIGSIIRDGEGELIGEYYFRDIQLNPSFKPEQFQRVALTRPDS